jgi:hypothetical protein
MQLLTERNLKSQEGEPEEEQKQKSRGQEQGQEQKEQPRMTKRLVHNHTDRKDNLQEEEGEA